MELREFLSHLRDVKGHGGQYMAKCPAHDDKTASLSVASGNNGAIVLKCQAGCNTGDVLRAVGLEMRDLYPRKAAGDTQAVEYLYTSIDGTPVHKKIRYPEKRFTQAHLDKAGNWVFNMKGVQALLYRLPEVAKGIAEGRTIYVVEGEKDADTLHKYGKTATCSAFGAGQGKWLAHYNGYLQGAHVCVIQDNDAVGIAFAQETAQSLLPVAASVKLLDLSRIWPEIPPHGDITDYIGAMQDKAQAVRQLEKLTEDTPLFASAPKPASLPPSAGETEEKRLFHGTCYRVKDGALYRSYERNGETAEQYLGNFYILAEAETIRDDGAEQELQFQLKAVCEGEELPSRHIGAQDFASMNFIYKAWGMALRPTVGQNTLAYYRDSISVQAKNARREHIYTHTGWREIGGDWVFLHAGGAIGKKQVRVELDGRLSRYTLYPAEDPQAGLQTALKMLDAAPREIMYPLLGMAFLSPLNEFLRRAGIEPSFLLYLLGTTGTMKSTVAALTLSFFGDFDNKSLPTSFKDTPNSLEKQGFLLKDVLTVIDDYHPTGSRQEALKMQAAAQQVSRMYGDRTGRGRMTAETKLRQSCIPRGNAIITGEDIPEIGQSGTARNLFIEVKKGDIDKTVLTDLQDNHLLLSACMASYLEWLIPQVDTLPDILKAQFKTLRQAAQSDARHLRIAETVAHLQIGMLSFLHFLCDKGVITEARQDAMAAEAWDIFLSLAEQQSKRIEQDKPVNLFLSALSELLATSQVYVMELGDAFEEHTPGFIGYRDETYYYLYTNTAYKAITQFYFAQGRNFPVSKTALLKQLAVEGILTTDGKTSTKLKKVRGEVQRFLWLRASALECKEAVTLSVTSR